MKKHILTIILILVFLAGLSVLFYPYVIDYFSSQSQTRVVRNYFVSLNNLSEEDYSKLLEDAREYNNLLRRKPDRYRLADADKVEYTGLLNFTGNGIMGAIEISKIGVNLPIYHGTDESVLQIGAGHFEGTSLPVGGFGTHTVISGHRGLPSSTLFTNLDQLTIGDMFVLRILGEELIYEIDQIVVVEPDDLRELALVQDKDYATLLTCTPYGINSHRLFVRGSRVPTTEETIVRARAPADAVSISSAYVILFIIPPVMTILLIYVVIRLRQISRY